MHGLIFAWCIRQAFVREQDLRFVGRVPVFKVYLLCWKTEWMGKMAVDISLSFRSLNSSVSAV